MNAKAIEAIEKYKELTKLLQESVVNNETTKTQKLSREIGDMLTLYELSTNIIRLEKEISDAKTLLSQNTNTEEELFYEDVISENTSELEVLNGKLDELLIPKDPNDSRDVILEIRAGTGGEEAALFASQLYRMYLRYCEQKGWNSEQISLSQAEQGGIKEVICLINGKDVFGRLKYEAGVHRVQRVPTTEASGRIHTSSASVVILPQVEEHEVELNEDDIKIDLYRAGGPGGQGVNTTDSAVRITHIPTGLVVSCQDERSQLKNKLRAMSILKSRLYDLQQIQDQENISGQRRNAIKTGDRSDKIKTYNFPQNRLTDHRIKQSWFSLINIMEGDLEEMLDTTNKMMRSENVI
ncbi:MAG TPA: peptide chain release factor 1 [Candidatus Dojkabacteria bacterium]|nr:peptide chain release factor 1 [Candidatus Dojkabacteria bacterium]